MATDLIRLAAALAEAADERLRAMRDSRLEDAIAADGTFAELQAQWEASFATVQTLSAAEQQTVEASLRQAHAAMAAAMQLVEQRLAAAGEELARLPQARRGLTAYLQASRDM